MIPVAYLADLFGRRKTIQCGATIYMCVCVLRILKINWRDMHLALEVHYRPVPKIWTWCSREGFLLALGLVSIILWIPSYTWSELHILFRFERNYVRSGSALPGIFCIALFTCETETMTRRPRLRTQAFEDDLLRCNNSCWELEVLYRWLKNFHTELICHAYLQHLSLLGWWVYGFERKNTMFICYQTYGTSASLAGTPREWRIPLGIQVSCAKENQSDMFPNLSGRLFLRCHS